MKREGSARLKLARRLASSSNWLPDLIDHALLAHHQSLVGTWSPHRRHGRAPRSQPEREIRRQPRPGQPRPRARARRGQRLGARHARPPRARSTPPSAARRPPRTTWSRSSTGTDDDHGLRHRPRAPDPRSPRRRVGTGGPALSAEPGRPDAWRLRGARRRYSAASTIANTSSRSSVTCSAGRPAHHLAALEHRPSHRPRPSQSSRPTAPIGKYQILPVWRGRSLEQLVERAEPPEDHEHARVADEHDLRIERS